MTNIPIVVFVAFISIAIGLSVGMRLSLPIKTVKTVQNLQGLLGSYYLQSAIVTIELLDKGEQAQAREELKRQIVEQAGIVNTAIPLMSDEDKNVAMVAIQLAAPYTSES